MLGSLHFRATTYIETSKGQWDWLVGKGSCFISPKTPSLISSPWLIIVLTVAVPSVRCTCCATAVSVSEGLTLAASQVLLHCSTRHRQTRKVASIRLLSEARGLSSFRICKVSLFKVSIIGKSDATDIEDCATAAFNCLEAISKPLSVWNNQHR